MPGAYAHITLVNQMRVPRTLERAGLDDATCRAVMLWFKFCELGAVSPDYPYLAFGNRGAQLWADLMHYDRTGDVVHAGIRRLRQMSGRVAEKCTAWLLGYASHVVTDATIHPVVELKVGPYADNKTAHRICEMHQDVHIFRSLNLEVSLAEHLAQGIGKCGDPNDSDLLDADVSAFWCSILADVHPTEAARNPPDPNKWHRGFRLGVDKIAEEGGRLWPLARHVAKGLGLVYPAASEIDAQYVAGLATPRGKMHYDEIFGAATRNVLDRWKVAANAIAAREGTAVAALGNWNLDTGRSIDTNQLVFWQEVA